MSRDRPSSAPARQKRLISRAALGRLAGKARSTTTEACQGALKAACVGKRVDAAHAAVLRWAGVSSYAELVSGRVSRAATASGLLLHETAQTVEQLAVHIRQPVAALARELSVALVPDAHVAVSVFGQLAGLSLNEAVAALHGELAPAVTQTGRVDLVHDVAMAWFAANPFPRRRGEPVADGFPLGPACVGNDIDADHPLARVFLARCLGRVPEAAHEF